MVTFGEPLGHVITLCGQILVSCRVLCVLVCVCACVVCAVAVWCVHSKLPCVDSKRARVYVQNFTVCTGTTPASVSTCAQLFGESVQDANPGETKYLLQVYAQEATLCDKKYDCSKGVSRAENQRFSLQSEKSRRGQT